GRQIVFRRREDYWARDLPVMKGRWNFDRYRVEYFRDRSADFEAFKAGVYNFREEFWSKLWATAYEPDEFPAVARGEVVRDTIPDDLPSGTQAYWINMRREKFQDIRVRRAIGLAFDFEWSNRTLFYGLYKRTDSIFEGGPMQAGAEPTPGERAILEGLGPELLATLPEGFIDQPAVSPPQTDGSGRLRRELREAAKLLDEAGWTIQDGVRKNAAGETLSIDFLESSPSFERITAPYVQNLQRLGIDATLRLIDASQAEKREDEFDYDITTGRFAMGLTPGTAMRDIFHSATAMANGSSNKSGVANPAIDRLVEMASAAETREELTDTVKALDRALRSLHIWVPQWHKGAHNLAFWDIYARPALKPKYERGVIDLWWVDREKAQRLDDKIET
ncbi:MAG: extracellular solute-binding protein, partial [Pseudomonadota bacterium]